MELWKVYRFARFVKKQKKSDAYEGWLIAQFCLKRRRLIIKRYTPEQVMDIVEYARKSEKNYLGRYVGENGKTKLKVSVPEGKKLLEFPLGTLQVFLNEYGLAISFLLSGTFVVVVVTATGLAIRLLRFIIGLHG